MIGLKPLCFSPYPFQIVIKLIYFSQVNALESNTIITLMVDYKTCIQNISKKMSGAN